MEEITKKIIDIIIKQWCEDKLYVNVEIDTKSGFEILYILKNKPNQKQNPRHRLSDRYKENKKQNPEDLVCRIDVAPTVSQAWMHFKSCYAIDGDFSGVYKYLEPFMAVIKSKVRQINALGIQVKLGMISLDEFDQISNSFIENKDQIIKEVYKEIRNKDIKKNKETNE